MQKGIIALDIDGTITSDRVHVSKNVVRYLSDLTSLGWQIIFVTGRTFFAAFEALKVMPFPYAMALQNGSILMEMPRAKVVYKAYLQKELLPKIEQICFRHQTDFILYSGYENQDKVFYREENFPSHILEYVKKRKKLHGDNLYLTRCFHSLNVQSFPAVKSFGNVEDMKKIAKQIEEELNLYCPIIRDVHLKEDIAILQITHRQVSKGNALRKWMTYKKLEKLPIIAAGDDQNDISLLKEADIKVVMETAPENVKSFADIIAVSAEKEGIISGLKKALEKR